MSKEAVNYDEEVRLYEYFKMILDRKITIMMIFAVSVLISWLVIFNAPKTYETNVIISLGSISSKLVMDKTEALQEIQSQRFLAEVVSSLKLGDGNLNLQDVLRAEDVNNPNLIKLIVKYSNAESAAKMCEIIANNFIAKGNRLIQHKIEVLKTQISELEENKNEIKSLKGNFNEKLYKAKNFDSSYSVMGNMANNYGALNNSVSEKIFLLKEQIESVKEFEVFRFDGVPKFPISPNKKLIFTIFSSFGLLFGIGFVLFQELWKRIGKEDKKA